MLKPKEQIISETQEFIQQQYKRIFYDCFEEMNVLHRLGMCEKIEPQLRQKMLATQISLLTEISTIYQQMLEALDSVETALN